MEGRFLKAGEKDVVIFGECQAKEFLFLFPEGREEEEELEQQRRGVVIHFVNHLNVWPLALRGMGCVLLKVLQASVLRRNV